MPNNEAWNVATARVAANISLSAAYIDLAAPKITATAATSSSISIALTTPSPNAVSYDIERSTNGVSWALVVTDVLPGEFPYSDNGLSAETQYFYRALAKDETTNSDYSGVSSDITLEGGVSPSYTPLVAEDFEGETLSQTYANGSWKSGYSVIDNAQVYDGTRALKIIAETYDGVVCGNSLDSYYGGRQTFPVKVTPGYTIWYRIRVFFPTTFSWGYVYQNGLSSDESDASACGLSADSDGNASGLKFMRLSESTSGGRNYIYLPTHRRNKSLPDESWGFMLNNEHSQFNEFLNAALGKVVPGTWQTVQLCLTVSSSGTGKMQAWLGETFLGERTNISTCSAAQGGIDEWAIGTHFNGGHYSDTGAANHKAFYVDDVVVATDMPGYGAPNATDAGGRPFIHPSTRAGDFA